MTAPFDESWHQLFQFCYLFWEKSKIFLLTFLTTLNNHCTEQKFDFDERLTFEMALILLQKKIKMN